MSDPKLKRARERIEAIFKEEDIAGFVVLHNAPGEAEHFYDIHPSYSILEGDFPSIRVRSTLAQYHGNQELQIEHRAATANMVSLIGTIAVCSSMEFLKLVEFLDKALGAEHTPIKRTDNIAALGAVDAMTSTDEHLGSYPCARPECINGQRDALLRNHLSALALVHEQAFDEGLWSVALTASENRLQCALRDLHAEIERTNHAAGAKPAPPGGSA